MDKFVVCKHYGYGHCYKRSGRLNGVFSSHILMGCPYETKTGRPSRKQVECKGYEPYEKEEEELNQLSNLNKRNKPL